MLRRFLLASLVLVAAPLAILLAQPRGDVAVDLAELKDGVKLTRIFESTSTPGVYALALEVTLPDRQWTLSVDSVSPADELGRVTVKLTGMASRPAPAPGVTLPAKALAINVELGKLAAGRFLVDVLLRQQPGGNNQHERIGAVVLEARALDVIEGEVRRVAAIGGESTGFAIGDVECFEHPELWQHLGERVRAVGRFETKQYQERGAVRVFRIRQVAAAGR